MNLPELIVLNMLCQSMSSQKPGGELLANVRQQLPEVVAVTSNVLAPSIAAAAITIPANPYLQPQPQLQSHSLRNVSMDGDTFGDQDPAVRTSLKPWMFNPPLLDTNSSALHAFANAIPVCHMPTPEGQNTLSHYSTGHLQNPLLAVGGISTPLSMAKSGDAISRS